MNISNFKNQLNLPEINEILKNSAWLLSGKGLKFLVAFVVSIFLARYLGPEKFGIYNSSLAFVMLFLPFVSLGLNNIVTKELVQDKKRESEYLISSLVLSLFASVIAFFIVISTLFFIFPDNFEHKNIILLIAFILFFRPFQIFNSWFQSKVLSKYTVIAQNAALIITNFIIILMILYKAPLESFACLITLKFALITFFLVNLYKKISKNTIDLSFFDYKLSKKLLFKGLPMILSGVGMMIYLKIDQLMLKVIIGDKAAGIYSIGVNLSDFFYFIPTIVIISSFPLLIRSNKESEQLFYRRFQKLLDILLLIAWFIAIIMSLFSDQIVNLLYGKEYFASGMVLSIMIWVVLFSFMRLAFNHWMIIHELYYSFAFISCFGAVINISLNLYLIPIFSEIGAAVATIISEVLLVLICYLYPKTRLAGTAMLKAIFVPVRILFYGYDNLFKK